ncbi:hypothetical protein NIES2100_68010 [Calothrix sp. NIES-2100]|uniref:peptidoglycan-binding domain-containing protein n=1 Tax=Calothrix sp. NIES-2100 TaxID=1954172 RepID=UPI000B5DF23F|nr:hypothetical protein NIES2100_68010 [Calothrix sp. NIES-2100]
METYIQSRGLERDYYWVVKKENQPEEELPNSSPLIKKATALIDDEVFSVVISRSSDNKLLLLVAGLQTKRQDIKTRIIRNSVAWIGKNEDEPILRKIAALALENKLENKINEVIDNSPEGGFKVDWEAIKELISVSISASESLAAQETKAKIALLSENRKQDLANELLRSSLPNREEVLVLVTKGKSKETLERAKVWRGLSNDPSIPTNWTHVQGTIPSAPTKPLSPLKIAAFVTVIIVIVAILIVIKLSPFNQLNSIANQPCGGNKEILTQIVSNLQPEKPNNEKVKIMQRILTTEKITVKIDGNFNEKTKKAVEEFQKQYNQRQEEAQKIKVDGTVDDATLKALWLETKDNIMQNNQKLEEELWNNGLCKP